MTAFRQLCLATLLVATAAAAVAHGQAQPPNAVSFEMPAAGRATIAIDDAQGRRVRNLLADLPYKAGAHAVEWDGRNDAGELVPAGSYQWTGLRRGDLHAVYRGSFQHGNPPWPYGKTGGWIADHSAAVTVAAVGDRMILGATEAEWGHGAIASDLSGQKQWGVRWMEKRSWCGGDAIAANESGRVFATSYPGEHAAWEIDPETGENRLVLETADIPAEHRNTESRDDYPVGGKTIAGLRLAGTRGDEVFVTETFGRQPRTHVLKIPTTKFGRLTYDRTLPVRPWSLAWLSDGRCVAVMDTTVDVLDTATGATAPLVTSGLSQPYGIAVDQQDRIFVSDQGATGVHQYTRAGQLQWRYMRLNGPASHQVKVFDAKGTPLATIGKEGGQLVGKIDPAAFMMPGGIAIDARGRLWVTEMSPAPKRVSVWTIPGDLSANKPAIDQQFFGPATYGGGAAMVDPKRPWRLLDVNYGTVWDVNLETGAFAAESLPWRQHDPWKEHGYRPDVPFTGRPGVTIEVDGRRFAAAQGGYYHGSDARWSPHRYLASGATMIGEYVAAADGADRFVPRAAIGNIRMWMRGRELNVRRESQWLPTPILDAARQRPDWPQHAAAMGMAPDATDVPHVKHERGSSAWIVHPWPAAISGMIWVDADGDAKVQPTEVTFHEMGDDDVITLDADLNVYTSSSKRPGVDIEGTFKLPRDGFNAVGAPVYRWENLQKISGSNLSVAHVGRDGSLLSHTSLYDAQGKRIWSYPYNGKGVKELGPQGMETLKPGRIHRVNAMWGVVDGPGDLGEVYMLHNNDGMVYLLTRRDGLFIGSLFRPYGLADGWDTVVEAKPGLVLDHYSLQDECFNGHFARAEASGQGFEAGKYYLTGVGRSAVLEVTGLDEVQRFAGGTITLADGEGLYGKGERFDPTNTGPTLAVARRNVQPLVARRPQPGQDAFAASQAAEVGGAKVRVAWGRNGLLMKWEMRGDTSPFVNTETDHTQLFSTGDACDVQVDSPSLGKLRFIVAMNGDAPAIVRLRYGGKPTPDAVTYTSGVGETVVPEVRKLGVKPSVRKIAADGYVVQFELPWKDLGIDPPVEGRNLRVELGLIASNPTGTDAASRSYWAAGGSEMVADVPTEARPTEGRGILIFE